MNLKNPLLFEYTNTKFSMRRGRQRCQGFLIDSRYFGFLKLIAGIQKRS